MMISQSEYPKDNTLEIILCKCHKKIWQVASDDCPAICSRNPHQVQVLLCYVIPKLSNLACGKYGVDLSWGNFLFFILFFSCIEMCCLLVDDVIHAAKGLVELFWKTQEIEEVDGY
jgi:hypothetical protein